MRHKKNTAEAQSPWRNGLGDAPFLCIDPAAYAIMDDLPNITSGEAVNNIWQSMRAYPASLMR